MPVAIKCPRCGGVASITMPGTVVEPHEKSDGMPCALTGSADEVRGPRRFRLEAALVRQRHFAATQPPKTVRDRAKVEAAEIEKEIRARKTAAKAAAKAAARARSEAGIRKTQGSGGPWVRVGNGGSPGTGKRS